MVFTRKSANLVPIEDTVFAVVNLAKEDKEKNGPANVVDATIGSLYDEEGKLVAYESVFDHYNKIDNRIKAKYASSFVGNESFRKQVFSWVTQGADINLAHSVIATPGGSGAVSLTIQSILDQNQTVILPDIAWGSYKLMASQNSINVKTYEMFEGDHFNIKSFKETVKEVMDTQDKILVVVNDPCHNPTGYSLQEEEWKEIITFLNECSKVTPCVLLDDIAYIDYSYDLENSRKYMNNFNSIGNNVMVIVAFSCSKTLTSYGLRCGAALILAQTKEAVREVEIVYEKGARATWSNIPNAAMDNFTWVTTDNLTNFLEEKGKYVSYLKERSDIFTSEANACGLPIYPYHEGFFVTLKIEDNAKRDMIHSAFIQNHIYTVKVNKGIRVAVCSLSVEGTKGLALKMKNIMDKVA